MGLLGDAGVPSRGGLLAVLLLCLMGLLWAFQATSPGLAASYSQLSASSEAAVSGTPYPAPSREYERQELLRVHADRLARVRGVCDKYGPEMRGLPEKVWTQFMVDHEHGLAYCRHGKVGTSTWLGHFLTLSHMSAARKSDISLSTHQLHVDVPGMFAVRRAFFSAFEGARRSAARREEAIEAMEQYHTKFGLLAFSFVRHPFERLISAYEDKVVNWELSSGRNYFDLHDDIVEKYGNIEFKSFVAYVLDNTRDCPPPPAKCFMDLHWRPYYLRCGYCDVDYDVIGKMETFQQDVKYIMDRANVTQLFPEGAFGDQKNERRLSHGLSQEERIKKYFSLLSLRDRQRLYQLYKIDFELFGYSHHEYIDL